MIFITLLFVAGLSYKIVAGVLALGVPVGIIGVVLIMKQALPLKPISVQTNHVLAAAVEPGICGRFLSAANSIIAIGSGQLWGKWIEQQFHHFPEKR